MIFQLILVSCVLNLFATLSQARFTINDIIYGEGTPDAVHLKRLRNTETDEEVRIVTDVGGKLEELHLRQENGTLVSVLASHHGNATAIRENAHFRGAMLAPWANRIKNGTYIFDGHTHYLEINEPDRGNALHGLLYNKNMTILEDHATEDHAFLNLGYHFRGEPGYPFHLDLNITYMLSAEGFHLRASARNVQENDRALPFYFGAHPYFLVNDVSKAEVIFDNCTRWSHIEMSPGAPRQGDLIPTGRVEPAKHFNTRHPIGGTKNKPTYFDDEYVALSDSECPYITQHIHDTASGNSFRLTQDNKFGFAQIFTGSMEKWNISAIALEPQSAEADAFNNHHDLAVLSAGEEWEGSFRIHNH